MQSSIFVVSGPGQATFQVPRFSLQIDWAGSGNQYLHKIYNMKTIAAGIVSMTTGEWIDPFPIDLEPGIPHHPWI